ncbi:MAG: DUF167 domain-containing protein [Candidatus Coatesbacteria bacterium]|nr:MAG: DUF167 domain-containing protein [Candidatus Coatesbacteria bacterium]
MVKLEVEVTPRSSRPGVAGRRGQALWVRVAAPPERGRANKEVQEVVASFLGLARGAVSIARGASARRKILEIEGLDASGLEEALRRAADEGV